MSEILPSVEVTRRSSSRAAAAIRARATAPPEVERSVEAIVRTVRSQGDRALLRYAKSLEGAELSASELRVSQAEIDSVSRRQPPALLRALRSSYARIKKVQGSLIPRLAGSTKYGGFEVSIRPRALPSVGCYVPGGRASYASTVLMTAGVARLAGVKRIVLCTPAGKDGEVNPAILAAASIVGVDELFRVGGAHAIAAMAYGTESLRRVEKIVGPGGRYVSAAKKVVSPDVGIDFYAGPTELVVMADESCEPSVTGWELMGQAEHGEETLCGLVTLDGDYAARVRSFIKRTLPRIDRREYAEGSLRRGFAAVCSDEETAFEFVNEIAPEHLSVMTKNPRRAGARISSAGLKLLGKYTPCAASDYMVGTDHVIPTAGLALARGPLSVLDFVKLDWSVSGTPSGLKGVLKDLDALARAEGLPNHSLSAQARFED